jgi:hypothetical protein
LNERAFLCILPADPGEPVGEPVTPSQCVTHAPATSGNKRTMIRPGEPDGRRSVRRLNRNMA